MKTLITKLRNNKKSKFILISSWIILSRTYDMYCTYQFTPDLSMEANPLVSVLGMGWFPLLSIIGLIMGFGIYAYYVSEFKKIDLQPKEKGLSFSQYFTYLYLGYKENWYATFYKLPKSLKRFTHYMGQYFYRAFAYVGIVSTVMWLLINNVSGYYQEYYSYMSIIYVVAIGAIVILFSWNKKMYAQYIKEVH